MKQELPNCPVATLRPVIKGAVAAAGAPDGAGREPLLANNDMPSITSGTSICAQAALLVANNIVPSAADVKSVAVRFIAFLLIEPASALCFRNLRCNKPLSST